MWTKLTPRKSNSAGCAKIQRGQHEIKKESHAPIAQITAEVCSVQAQARNKSKVRVCKLVERSHNRKHAPVSVLVITPVMSIAVAIVRTSTGEDERY